MAQAPIPGAAGRLAPQTRAGIIEVERQTKAANLRPETHDRAEATLEYIRENRIVERFTQGVANIRVRLGGLITGSGFAVGPEYYRPGRTTTVRASARASLSKFYLIDAELDAHSLADGRAFVNLLGVHHNYPRIDYYGPGAGSAKSARSSYLLEDTSFAASAGIKPFDRLRIGGIGRYYLVNIGPGRDERFVPTERIFTELTTPGIRQQGDFIESGGFIQYDWRDNPGGPRRGGNYVARFTRFSDLEPTAFSFNNATLEAQQYIPFFNERRVIALRARVDAADPLSGHRVPFYLQPRLGGSEDLRGFRPFRFYDNSRVVLNAEYRWEIFSGLDMALFADAGRVFPEWDDITLRGLEKSYGFGFRFNVRNDVFMRLDTGFSREGFQVWLKFNNVF